MKTATYRPTTELLESRDLMAFSVMQSGTLLKFTGTNAAEKLAIVDLGGSTFRVELDENNSFTYYNNVKSVEVDAGQGNDLVRFMVQNSSPSSKLNIKLGNGNDIFEGMAFGRGSHQVQVDGGNGNDRISCTNVGVDGTLEFIAKGGSGNDSIDAAIASSGTPDNNTGTVKIMLSGDAGNDGLGIAYSNRYGTYTNKGMIDASADGGDGNDRINLSVGVGGIAVNHGSLKMSGQGGAGNDTLDFSCAKETGIHMGIFNNTNLFDVQLSGGLGSDALTANVGSSFNIGNSGQINLRVDGNAGNDLIDARSSLLVSGNYRSRIVGGQGIDRISHVARYFETFPNSAIVEADMNDDLITVTAMVKVFNARKDRIKVV